MRAAIDHFQRAVALHADFAAARVNLGSALGKLGEYQEAEWQYRHAVELNPNATNLVCLGASFGAQGRHDEEEVCYRHALTLEPDQADAHQNLAWLHLKRGNLSRGLG